MTIEFRCTECGQLLKVPDEAAGRRAQCPKCNTAMAIPSGSDDAPPAPSAAQVEAAAGGDAGTQTPVAATPYIPIELGVKATLSQTVAVFKANLVSCVLAIIISWGITGVLSIAISLGVGALAALFKFPDMSLLLGMPLLLIAGTWVKVGAIRYFITVARGEPASLKLLFSGSQGFAAFFSTAVLLGIVCSIGMVIFVIPGIWLGSMLWPSVFLAVDRDLDMMRAFRAARMLTKGNIFASLALIVIGYAIIGLSVLAFGIGLLFGMAFAVLMFAVMYNTLVTGGDRVEG